MFCFNKLGGAGELGGFGTSTSCTNKTLTFWDFITTEEDLKNNKGRDTGIFFYTSKDNTT